MPEGDTIHRAARTLAKALTGATVVGAAAHPRTGIDARRLLGRMVRLVEPRAKHLLVWLAAPRPSDPVGGHGEVVLHTHLGMSGSWHLYRPGQRWAKPESAATMRLDTEQWTAVCFQAAVCELLSPRDVDRHPVLAGLGPDLAAATPDLDEARRRLAEQAELAGQGGRPLADVLLDQRVFAGVGNVYKSELCFLHGLHPLTPVAMLDEAARERLLADAARLLRRNAESASSARGTTAPGEPGLLSVYGRAGKPCRRCGTAIRSAMLGTPPRRTAWCPRCQPEPGAPPD